MSVGVMFLLLFLSFYISFLPSIIAFRRDHPSRIAILLVNIFLSWTGIAWIVALVWAISHQKDKQEKTVVINNHIIVQGHQSTMEVPSVAYSPESVMQILPPRAYVPVPATPQGFGRRM